MGIDCVLLHLFVYFFSCVLPYFWMIDLKLTFPGVKFFLLGDYAVLTKEVHYDGPVSYVVLHRSYN